MTPLQTPEQLAIAVALDLNDLENYALRADALLRGCIGGKP